MIKILLITDSNSKHEERIKDMLDNHSVTYRIDYELINRKENEDLNVDCDFAISLVKYLILDGVKMFDGMPIALDSCGEKIEKDILNQMLKLKVKQNVT